MKRLFRCTKSAIVFNADSVISADATSFVAESETVLFELGTVYSDLKIAETFKSVPLEFFKVEPLFNGVFARCVEAGRNGNQYHSVEVMCKFFRTLPIEFTDKLALKMLTAKMEACTNGMNFHEHASVEHGTLWCNRLTFENMKNELTRELAK